MAYDLGPKIGIDGEAEFRKSIQNVSQQIKTLGSEMKSVTSAFEAGENAEETLAKQTQILTDMIAAQERKIQEQTRMLKESEQAHGKAATETLRWAQVINESTTDLNRMKTQLRDLEDGVEDVGDAMDDSGVSIESFGKALITGFSVKAIADGVKELVTGIVDLVRETQEYRTIMASLEISSQKAGYTADQTSETYKKLYGVLGDQQTAATATANLQAIGLSQSQLMAVTNAAIGAWATYGDSIPIDGLAEAINETIQAGTVTGTFADVLNWAGESEDAFNEKLAEAETKAERTNLVMQALANQGLAAAGAAWQQNNQDIVAVNEAQAELDEAMGRLGELLAPLAADIINFGADAIGALVDWLKQAAESAKIAYEWLREFFNFEEKESRRHELLPGAVDGSHATGLSYVPFDGYLAQLHKGEMVLTAAQAALLRSGNAGSTGGNELAAAMAAAQSVSVPQEVYLTLRTDNGLTLGRWMVPFIRAEDSANPEVVSDPL